MDNEVPCRDTDPVNMNLVNRTADTMAFTIDFGQQDINQEEKVKKFERFAQRSSLRRVNSPRQQEKVEKDKVNEDNKVNNNNNTVCDTTKKVAETRASKTTTQTPSPPVSKERRNTVVLEKSSINLPGRSMSHNRLSTRKIISSTRKSSGNDDALSHTGTYTMDDEQDHKKVWITFLQTI